MLSPSNIYLLPSCHSIFIPTRKNAFCFLKCYYLNFYFTFFFNCMTLILCDLKFHKSENICTSSSCRMWTTKFDSKKCWKCFNPLAWMIVSHQFKFSYNTKKWLNVTPWTSFYYKKRKNLLLNNVEVKQIILCLCLCGRSSSFSSF